MHLGNLVIKLFRPCWHWLQSTVQISKVTPLLTTSGFSRLKMTRKSKKFFVKSSDWLSELTLVDRSSKRLWFRRFLFLSPKTHWYRQKRKDVYLLLIYFGVIGKRAEWSTEIQIWKVAKENQFDDYLKTYCSLDFYKKIWNVFDYCIFCQMLPLLGMFKNIPDWIATTQNVFSNHSALCISTK